MSERKATAWRCSLLVVGLFVAVCSGAAVAAPEPVDLDPDTDLDGSGTPDDPFNVTNASELQAMAGNLTADYQLTETINATNTTDWDGGNGFDPIGNSTHEFNGSLDGNGFGIENLTIDRTSDDIGLFGFVGTSGKEAQFSELTLTNVTVTGGNAVGALVGNSTHSAIDNVTITGGNITGSGDAVGGLVGAITSETADEDDLIDSQVVLDTVTGLTNVGGVVGATNETGAKVWIENVSVTADVEGDSNVGGLLGNEFLTYIKDVTTNGTVTATSTGTANAGGLVGRFTGSGGTGGVDIYESSSNVTVSANGANVGGLLGLSEGRVSRVYATGNVTGASRVGGLFGMANNTGPVASSAFATGNVTATGTTGDYFGGLIGDHRGGRMQEVYATGSVDGNDYTGGLIGSTNTTGGADITDAYAAGNVSGDANTGGLLGYRNNTNVVASHWDEVRTGQSASAGGSSLQTEDMIGDEAEIRMTGFDFGGTWEIINDSAPDATADGYPILAALDREPQLLFPDVDSDDGNDDDNGNDDDTGGNGGGGGGGGGGGSGDDDGAADKTVTDDGDTEVTGGKSGDVIEFGDETTRDSSSITGLDNIAVDGLSVELANDRDFFINVETYERGEEDEVDATADTTETTEGGTDGETTDADGETSESAGSTGSSITASFERQTETVSVGYVTVTHNLEPEDIAEATFEFSVRDEYLDALDVDPENVSLYRQTDEWSSLPTDFQERSQGRYRFEADSPGFSSFAIGTNAPLSIVINGTLGETVVQEGRTATALATVNNRGQNPVTHTVNLTADGETVATETVTVAGGEIAEVPVAFAPSAGEYAMAVDDVPIGSLTVTESESSLWWLFVVLAVLLVVVWWRQREDDDAPTET